MVWCSRNTEQALGYERSQAGLPIRMEWTGSAEDEACRLIPDLGPYTVRPEGVDLIQVSGEWRVLFVEDRYRAIGYATRNAVHWPVSILEP